MDEIVEGFVPAIAEYSAVLRKSRTPRKRNKDLPYLPNDIWEKILIDLDLRSSIRSKLVCKHWRSFLNSPSYIPKNLKSPCNLPESWLITVVRPWVYALYICKDRRYGIKSCRYKAYIPFDPCWKFMGVGGSYIFFINACAMIAWNPITGDCHEFRGKTRAAVVMSTPTTHKVMRDATEHALQAAAMELSEETSSWQSVSCLGEKSLWLIKGLMDTSSLTIARDWQDICNVFVPTEIKWVKGLECNGEFVLVFGYQTNSTFRGFRVLRPQLWKLFTVTSMPARFLKAFRQESDIQCVATGGFILFIRKHSDEGKQAEEIVMLDYGGLRNGRVKECSAWDFVYNPFHTRRNCIFSRDLHAFYPSRAPLEEVNSRKRKRSEPCAPYDTYT